MKARDIPAGTVLEVSTSRAPTGLVLVEDADRAGDVVTFMTTRVDRYLRPAGVVGGGQLEVNAGSDVTVWDGR